MQIVKLDLNHYNFFCPATGEQILSDVECNDDAKSLQGYWVDEFFEEPIIKNKTLATDWNSFQKKNDANYDSPFEMLRDFFTKYEKPGWVVFELCHEGDHITVWKVLDLNVAK
jgi:hypothetical protein